MGNEYCHTNDMNNLNKSIVKTLCPICGGEIVMHIKQVQNVDKEILKKAIDDKLLAYNGIKWVYEKGLGALALLNGLSYSTGENVAKTLTGFTDSIMGDKAGEVLNELPDTIYLMEFVCAKCGYLINRYFTSEW